MSARKDWQQSVEVTGCCWYWRGYIDKDGYGRIGDDLVHRRVYRELVKEIPKGLTLDHICRTRNCINPDHLEPVTQAVNTRRGYHTWQPGKGSTLKNVCRQGHILADVGCSMQGGRLRCKACQAEYQRRYRESGKKALTRHKEE